MMKKAGWLIGLSALAMVASAPAHATVVTFEDLSLGNLADGYGAVSGWNSVGSVVGEPHETIGSQALFGLDGGVLTFNAPVVFEGLYYKSYDVHPFISIYLSYQDIVVGAIYGFASNQLTWYASEYTGYVNQLYIDGRQGGFSMDNLTYTQPVSQVPLPAAVPLFLTGLGLLSFASKRRK